MKPFGISIDELTSARSAPNYDSVSSSKTYIRSTCSDDESRRPVGESKFTDLIIAPDEVENSQLGD